MQLGTALESCILATIPPFALPLPGAACRRTAADTD